MLQQTTVNQCLHFSTVFGALVKCKQHTGITVESGKHVKRVKITLNVFAVYSLAMKLYRMIYQAKTI